VSWLKQVKRGIHCLNAWCVYEGKKHHVRLITSALPPEKAAEARKKREQEAHEARAILHHVHQCLDSPILDMEDRRTQPMALNKYLSTNPSYNYSWILDKITIRSLFTLSSTLFIRKPAKAALTVQSGLRALGQTCSHFFCLTWKLILPLVQV
jgi:hypothetical protein